MDLSTGKYAAIKHWYEKYETFSYFSLVSRKTNEPQAVCVLLLRSTDGLTFRISLLWIQRACYQHARSDRQYRYCQSSAFFPRFWKFILKNFGFGISIGNSQDFSTFFCIFDKNRASWDIFHCLKTQESWEFQHQLAVWNSLEPTGFFLRQGNQSVLLGGPIR